MLRLAPRGVFSSMGWLGCLAKITVVEMENGMAFEPGYQIRI